MHGPGRRGERMSGRLSPPHPAMMAAPARQLHSVAEPPTRCLWPVGDRHVGRSPPHTPPSPFGPLPPVEDRRPSNPNGHSDSHRRRATQPVGNQQTAREAQPLLRQGLPTPTRGLRSALAHGRRRRRPGPLPPARPPRERRSLAKLGERDRAAPVGFQMFQRGSLTRTFPRCWSR